MIKGEILRTINDEQDILDLLIDRKDVMIGQEIKKIKFISRETIIVEMTHKKHSEALLK